MSPVSLAELISRGSLIVNDGYRTKTSEHGSPGFPILRVAEILDGSIRPTLGDHVRAEFEDKIGIKLSQPGDVLLTTKGTVGRRAIMPPASPAFAYSPQLCFFRVLDQSIDPRWLYYWLGSEAFWSQATGVSQQTDMAAYISLRDLRQIQIALPPVEEQHGISATLGALDDKIHSNEQAIQLLRDLMQLHFRRVLEIEPPELVPLVEVATVTKGRSYKSTELQPSTAALVTLKSIDRNGGYKSNGLKSYVGPFKPEQVVQPGELVVAQTDLTQGAEVVGRGVRVPPVNEFDTLVASLDLVIVRPSGGMPVEYLYGLLTSEAFRQHCRSHTTGTTVLHLAKDAIPTWLAPVASADAQETYAAIARPLLARMDALRHEQARLESLRDALLPELLSGRVRVPEVAEAIA